MKVLFSIWIAMAIAAIAICIIAKEKKWSWVVGLNMIPILGQVLIFYAFYIYRRMYKDKK